MGSLKATQNWSDSRLIDVSGGPWHSFAMNIGLFGALFFLFDPTVRWVINQILQPENELHVVALILVLGVTAQYVYKRRFLFLPDFQFSVLPFVVLVVAVIGYLFNEFYTGINIFSASLMLLAVYGVSGFYLYPESWRRAAYPGMLFILLLPFEGYLDIYLGFPLRVFAADMANSLLAGTGINAISNESILLIENRAADVDLDCSGLKGLWAGCIFYVALSWIEGSKNSINRLVGLVCLLASLTVFNILRIFTLVYLTLVLNLPSLADSVHTTLGVLGFVASCALGWLIIRFQPFALMTHSRINRFGALNKHNRSPIDQSDISTSMPSVDGLAEKHQWKFLLVSAFVLIATGWHQPFPKPVNRYFSELAYVHQKLGGEKEILSTREKQFFSQNAALAGKYTLDWNGKKVSLLLVFSEYWKAQHDPRNCYQAQGLAIDHQVSLRMGRLDTTSSRAIEVKQLSFNDGKQTGLFWYQSPDKQTADYTSRIFSGWRDPSTPWAMVSLAWQGELSEDSQEDLVRQINQQISAAFSAAQIRHASRYSSSI